MTDQQRPYVDSDPDAQEGGSVEYLPSGGPGTWQWVWNQYRKTLRSPRTRGTYEKAVMRFFEWPGVPERLDDPELTFELLNDYCWSLKARAEPGYEAPTRGKSATGIAPSTALVPMPPFTTAQQEPGAGAPRLSRAITSTGPLAPGTVGTYVTGLKGVLIWAIKRRYLRHLTADDVRDALKPPPTSVLHEHDVVWESEWSDWLDCVGTPVLVDPLGPRGYLVDATLRRAQARLRARNERRMKAKLGGAPYGAVRMGSTTVRRDVLIVRLLLITWVRNAELRALNVSNLHCMRSADGREHWMLHLAATQTKGRHEPRTLPVPNDWIRDYGDYLAAEGRDWADANSPLFTTDERARLAATTFAAIFTRATIEWHRRHPNDSRHFSAHGMRRSGATAARNGNPTCDPPRPPMPIEMVSKMLGHARIETTIRYLASGDELTEREPYTLHPPQPVHLSRAAGASATPPSPAGGARAPSET